MRAVIQRVMQPAEVKVEGQITGKINKGLVILLGIRPEDTIEDIIWLSKKIVGLRIFNDQKDIMNLSVKDIGGSILVISQFTLYASTKKGNRPSYINAARPEIAQGLYRQFVDHTKNIHGLNTEEGVFGADMKVSLINDGPVTIIIDSKIRE